MCVWIRGSRAVSSYVAFRVVSIPEDRLSFKMPVVGLGIFAVLLNALRNAQGINKEHLWVCLSGCFQRGFIKEGRPRVNAGSDILWAGSIRDWMTRTQHEARWEPAFISLLPDCGFCAVIGLMLLTLPCTGDPYPVGSDHEPQQALPPWSCSLSKFLVTVMGKITVLKWASSKVTGFSTAQITDQKSHLSWVNTQKATAAICGDDGGGEKKLHWIEKSTTELFRGRSWHTEVGHMK